MNCAMATIAPSKPKAFVLGSYVAPLAPLLIFAALVVSIQPICAQDDPFGAKAKAAEAAKPVIDVEEVKP